jgi:hypothetical protein
MPFYKDNKKPSAAVAGGFLLPDPLASFSANEKHDKSQ